MSDEDELQQTLTGVLGKVEWHMVPIMPTHVHNGVVYQLLGASEEDNVVVCSCGWAMRFDGEARLSVVEDAFAHHVGDG